MVQAEATGSSAGPVEAKTKADKRNPLETMVESGLFKNFILLCIILNAIALGVDAQFGPQNPWHGLIENADLIFLGIFTAEAGLKILGLGAPRYFRDGWNAFDFLVVVASWVSVAPFVAALRTLRVLRVFRLISSMPQMRRVVEALGGAVPGMGATVAVLFIVFFIGALMATTLFGSVHEGFANLGASMLTLFQLTQFDGWGDIVNQLSAIYPWAWAFFVTFVIVASFAVLNLFIGVIVDAVQDVRLGEANNEAIKKGVDEIEADVDALSAESKLQLKDLDIIMAELKLLRAEVADLRSAARPPAE